MSVRGRLAARESVRTHILIYTELTRASAISIGPGTGYRRLIISTAPTPRHESCEKVSS